MKIPGRAVLPEKVILIECKSTPDTLVEFVCPCIPRDGSQRTEVVPSVKIVHPSLRWQFTIEPAAVRLLLLCCVPRRFQCRIEKLRFAGVLVHTAKQCGSQEICVIDLAPNGW